jgi:hypothetical protein
MAEANKKPDEFYIQTLMLAEVIKRILDRKASIFLSRVADFHMKPIVDFKNRMRVSGIEKFDGVTYISVVYFYLDQEAMKEERPVGTLIVYMEDDYIEEFLRKLDYPKIDEDDQEAIEDACGTITNLIAGNFKTGLTQLGYQELMMSHFMSYRTEVINGVEYDRTQTQKYEISFDIRSRRRIVAELVMGKIPKISDLVY